MIEKYDNIKNQIYSHPKLGRRIAIIIFGILAFVSYTVLVSLNLNYARERELQTGYAQQSSLSKILVSHAEATLKKLIQLYYQYNYNYPISQKNLDQNLLL